MIEFVRKDQDGGEAPEAVTVTGILREVVDAICDGYCKYPEICIKEYGEDEAEDWLYDKYCAGCPMNRLLDY